MRLKFSFPWYLMCKTLFTLPHYHLKYAWTSGNVAQRRLSFATFSFHRLITHIPCIIWHQRAFRKQKLRHPKGPNNPSSATVCHSGESNSPMSTMNNQWSHSPAHQKQSSPTTDFFFGFYEWILWHYYIERIKKLSSFRKSTYRKR